VPLRAWNRAVGDPHAAQVAAEVTTRVAATPVTNEYTDIISGAAGTLLVLLDDDSPTAQTAAGDLADHLVATAEPAPIGLHWRMTPEWPTLTPGFSHGTAGVSYALAAAGRALERPDLLEVANCGAQALLDVGNHPDGWAVPLSIPRQAHRPPVFFGWCHGPTGTVRLFVLLEAIDPQPQWRDAIEACLQALRDSRIPQRLHPGYWDNVGRCCGTAGVGKLLLDRYHVTRDPALLTWADALADDVVDRAVPTPHGLAWSNTEHTATPPDLPPEPGLMQGAAGIAGWLAQLAAAHRNAPNGDLLGLTPPWI
jgi:lantibiotic modifying enzyme